MSQAAKRAFSGPAKDRRWFPPLVIGSWLAVSCGLSLLGGWHALAKKYYSVIGHCKRSGYGMPVNAWNRSRFRQRLMAAWAWRRRSSNFGASARTSGSRSMVM
jgi:hypothetical protein